MKKVIQEKVIEICVEKLGIERNEIKSESKFTDDLGCDSLDEIELIMEFEREFDISIPGEKAEQVKTVNEAIELIWEISNEPNF